MIKLQPSRVFANYREGRLSRTNTTPPFLRMRIMTGLGVFYEHFCEKMASNSTLTSIYVSVYILYERIIVEGTNIPAHHLCNYVIR